ncbi:MAG: outer membrane protein transport protein [Prevotellaceae bacterium]|jgi:hypothetical protein|nr:outer membrane protein transport protein [Prevotellaceae bacterium]
MKSSNTVTKKQIRQVCKQKYVSLGDLGKPLRTVLFVIISVCLASQTDAQSIDDILRVSYQDYEGSARFASMGGAFGALGGDVSSMGINPAGVAVFRKGYFSITPSVLNVHNNATFADVATNSSRTRFGVSSIGMVSNLWRQKNINWNVGVTYQKKANFNRRTVAESPFGRESIIDYFSDKANSDIGFFDPEYLNASNAFNIYSPFDWDVPMAYGTYLINPDEGGYAGNLAPEDRMQQKADVLLTGSSSEAAFSFGMSLADKFYAGMLIGVGMIDYEKDVIYSEFAHPNNSSDLNSLIYNTNLKIIGYGFNTKIGFIYRPIPSIRIGAAIHSPDYIFASRDNSEDGYTAMMDNRYSASMTAYYNSADNGTDVVEDGPGEEYYLFFTDMQTPLKTVASVAYTFGKFGLISADCEYVDYSKIKIGGNEPKSEFNADIKQYFKSAVNLRLGGEIWLGNVALRAGYIYNQSPDKDYDLSRKSYSAGIGYRLKNISIDFAYRQTKTTDYYTPYSNARRITENLNNRQFMLSFGLTLDTNR